MLSYGVLADRVMTPVTARGPSDAAALKIHRKTRLAAGEGLVREELTAGRSYGETLICFLNLLRRPTDTILLQQRSYWLYCNRIYWYEIYSYTHAYQLN